MTVESTNLNDDGVELLVTAIVIQALKEWKQAYRGLQRSPHNPEWERQKKGIEAFFRSGWFYELTGLDGNIIVKKLNS